MAAVTERVRAATGEPLRMVLTLMGREIRDTLRDWRIVVPTVILTLFFPALMSFVADAALDWVARYGAPIIGERMLPFLLMIVGFFPISFSLVIALETFVGEKERRSLEPLLATPLTDTQLYLGKTLAAMTPPLLAAYLGITVYLVGLYFFKGWTPPPILLALILLLTTTEALVMVSGAVVVSSQTTSVRAANLLASFIIIPMALLIQGEAIIMFWANYSVLWWIVLFLVFVDVVLVRMGIHTFNREELLGREIDELNIGSLWRTFCKYLRWEPWLFGLDLQKMPAWLRWLGMLGGLYGRDIPTILRRSWLALVVVVIGLLFSAYIGCDFAARYQLPPEMLRLEHVSAETFAELPAVDWLPTFTIWGVLGNNVRSLLAGTLLAVFSFGTLAVVLLMAPLAIVFFFVTQAAHLGYNPVLFFAAFVLPHGVLELPAASIATALAVRLGATFMSPPRGMTVGEGWLWALADFVKVFIALVLPLLTLAAAIEVHVTPTIVVWALGG
ncbi:MAG TPA: ABC transporter permease subunit [Thermoflexia bacterium]|nr:ABC transporter permease subunit [Thermoflexia bacterium]